MRFKGHQVFEAGLIVAAVSLSLPLHAQMTAPPTVGAAPTSPGPSSGSPTSPAPRPNAPAISYTLPFNFTITSCNNQPVNFSGRIHVTADYRRDPSGGLHYRLDIVPQNFLARNTTTGENYRVVPDVRASMGQGATGNPAFITTFNFRLSGARPGDHLLVHARTVITTDANGAPMLSIVNPEVRCE